MTDITFTFFVLLVGVTLSLIGLYHTLKIFFAFLKSRREEQSSVEAEARRQSREMIEASPELKDLVTNIVTLESYPESDACKAQAAILKGKLKLMVRNPVIREMLKSIARKK